MTPSRRRAGGTRPWLGLGLPAAAMLVGVGTIQVFTSGALWLAWTATIATPLLAAAVGWSLRWPTPVFTVIVAFPVYLLAWQGGGHTAEFARALLVVGACLTVAAWLATFTDAHAIAVGLVVLVAVDCYLVWGAHEVAPASSALDLARLPSVGIFGLPHRPLPPLQQITLGNSMMGWLDLLAPALLAMLAYQTQRLRAAIAVTVASAALAWGLLLLITSPIPATVSVLAGLAVLYRRLLRRILPRSSTG